VVTKLQAEVGAADASAGAPARPRVTARLAVTFLVTFAFAGLAAPAARAAVARDSVGVYSEELERANSVSTTEVAAAQRGARVGLVRQPFSWARIETSPGHFDFSVYDDVMAAAASAGLAVLPVLMDPPAWRSTAPASGRVRAMYPPRDPADMAALATALVRRYGPSGDFWAAHPTLPAAPIHSWQIWNEPNIRAFWATGPDPAAYVHLLDAVGSAIRAADPSAEIVAAGLPYADSGLSVSDFIAAMYAAGARGTYDTMAIHAYASDPAGVIALLRAVRAQLDRLGEAERPIWVTEFGWATGGPPVTVTTSEPGQAKLLGDTIALMRQARDVLRLRGFVAFRWRDVAPNSGQTDVWSLHAGLLREDGSPKPALDAFGVAADAWLRDAPSAAAASGPSAAIVGAPAGATPAVLGISRRVLRIRRYISRGRLVVLVDVPPGGGTGRVRIACDAIRGRRVAVHQVRRVATRRRVARAIFRLGPHARSAALLRVRASQGTASAARVLALDARRPA
jgi:hypothetical protein